MNFHVAGHSVLIADDQEELREVLGGILVALGCTLLGAARDGREAVEMARTLKPDFLVLDIVMPVMDGVEAARQILAERSVPVIFGSAYADEERIEAARELNVQAFLVKPFTVLQLRSAIGIAFAQHEKQIADREKIAALRAELDAAKGPPLPPLTDYGLTPRETEVLLLLAKDRTNAEIAAALGSATRTVEKHVEHVLKKLGVETRVAAARRVRG